MQFYHQKKAFVGDVIPFYWEGKYHLFYLYDTHAFVPGGQHTWAHAVSDDLVEWKELPVAVPLGKEGDPDSFTCGTGSVVYHEGLFHIFYLGLWLNKEMTEQRQTVCHTVSKDLIHWQKDPNNPVTAPDRQRYTVDWKDPHTFWDPEQQEFLMATTAGFNIGPVGHEGCLALMASKDLQSWECREPLFAPYQYHCMECPDVFYWKGWWYLFYSVYPPMYKTVYRKSRTLKGPWESGKISSLDDSYFYAGKTAGDGEKRYLFGWVQTKGEDRDNAGASWGGNLSVRELTQSEDGSLSVKIPDARVLKGQRIGKSDIHPQIGNWMNTEDGVENQLTDGFAYVTVDNIKINSQIKFKVIPKANTRTIGLFVRTKENLSTGYCIRIELSSKRVTMSSVVEGELYNTVSQPYLEIKNEIDCIINMEDTIIEAFIGESVSLVGRWFDHLGTTMALFTEEGSAAFRNIEIAELPSTW